MPALFIWIFTHPAVVEAIIALTVTVVMVILTRSGLN